MIPQRDVDPGPEAPEKVLAVVEIPKGSKNKYEIEEFFETYKVLEGKPAEVAELLGREDAVRVVARCLRAYRGGRRPRARGER